MPIHRNARCIAKVLCIIDNYTTACNEAGQRAGAALLLDTGPPSRAPAEASSPGLPAKCGETALKPILSRANPASPYLAPRFRTEAQPSLAPVRLAVSIKQYVSPLKPSGSRHPSSYKHQTAARSNAKMGLVQTLKPQPQCSLCATLVGRI